MQETLPSPAEQAGTREALRVTWVGAGVDAALGLGKVFIGIRFFSHALVADGIHTLSDLLTDFLVLALLKVSRAAPDAEHPYGHARFETLGTALLGFLLVAVAGGMGYDSARNLHIGAPPIPPEWPALAAALVSLLAKEGVFRYTRAAARRLNSPLLLANAWHSRSDAWSSLVVCIGVGGAMLGFGWLDDIAALAVALFIARIGWELGRKSLRELVDTAVEPDELAKIEAAAMQVEGVRGVHSFKSRRMGAKMLLELHLQVAPHLSASESHHIGDCVIRNLLAEFSDISHIIFHIDTEDDDRAEAPPLALPLRAEASARIDRALRKAGARRANLTLHYLREKIEAEIFIEAGTAHAGRAKLRARVEQELARVDWLRRVRLWFPD